MSDRMTATRGFPRLLGRESGRESGRPGGVALIAVFVIVTVVFPGVPARADDTVPFPSYGTACHTGGSHAGMGSQDSESHLLPRDDVFQPLLADMKQPRVYASYRRVEFLGPAVPTEGHGSRINVGIVSAGGEFGLWTHRGRSACNGVQVGFFGAIFSQFNLSSSKSDLLNSDFIVGPQFTARQGRVSTRLRALHQSSHLGDEFLLASPQTTRVDISFEWVDVLLSYDYDWLRVYGGGGRVISSSTSLDPGFAHAGIEFRGGKYGFSNAMVTPVFGADFQAFEVGQWGVTKSLAGGFELYGSSSEQRLRVLLAWLRGSVPFGQFFLTETIESFGLMLQYDL